MRRHKGIMAPLLLMIMGMVVMLAAGWQLVADRTTPKVAVEQPDHYLWSEYLEDPRGHPQIPDCSWAGYRFGNQDPPLCKPTLSVARFGADGSDDAFDDDAFADALAHAENHPGSVIHIPPGTYHLNSVMRIGGSGTVLQGEGVDRTRLVFHRSLSDIAGFEKQWSWRGGLIWVESRGDTQAYCGTVRIMGECDSGQRQVTVAPESVDALRGAVGRTVVLRYTGDWSFIEIVISHPNWRSYDWDSYREMNDGKVIWEWSSRVDAVEGNCVLLAHPLRMPIRKEWDVHIGYRYGGIEEVGIEDLHVEMTEHERKGHLQDSGFNGIFLSLADHCWVRNVRLTNADNGIILERSSHNTLQGIVMDGSSMHHASSFRSGSHDNVMRDFFIRARSVHHGIGSQDLASGNVWAEGIMLAGTVDAHRGMPFDNIRTNLSIRPSGGGGGAGFGGPLQGRRNVNWNIACLSSEQPPKHRSASLITCPDLFSSGAIVGMRNFEPVFSKKPSKVMPQGPSGTVMDPVPNGAFPLDLHMAQRKHRLRLIEALRR